LIASSESQRQTMTPETCSQIPRATTSAASSQDDQRARAPRYLRAARTPGESPQPAPEGEKVGGLPRRGRSSRPAKRCSKNRFRRCETTSRPHRNRVAIIVAQAVGRHQHHLSPRYLPIRQRIRTRRRPGPRVPRQSTRSDTGCASASVSLHERAGCHASYGQGRVRAGSGPDANT
jgi:hypothetical protein